MTTETVCSQAPVSRRAWVSVVMAGPLALRWGRARAAIRSRVGLSLPLTGVQATVAAELLAGYQLAFQNARSLGVEVEPVVVDDHSKAELTAAAIERMGRDPSIVAASGIVGTPHAKLAIPAARTAGLPLVGIRSGAAALRDGLGLVYHLRASYEAELTKMVNTLVAAHKRVSIIASADSFGEAAAKHAIAEIERVGLEVGVVAMAERNGSNVTQAVDKALTAPVPATALLVLMITRPAIQAVAHARGRSYLGATYTMSFTAGSELAAAGSKVYRGLGLVSAFPVVRAAHDQTSEGFRRAATAAGRADLLESVTAAEGWWYGTALCLGLARAGENPSRPALIKALEGRPAVHMGDEELSFDERRVGRRYLRVAHFDSTGLLRV